MWETIREDGHVTCLGGSSVGSGCAGFMELAALLARHYGEGL